jgi:UDP-N-acetylmuramoyl-tripeptide--D-alanyl-D-alanine ligase
MHKKIFKNIIVKIITWQARLVLKRYHPKIIAITGSVGKTSTKDAIFTVLSKFKSVRKSEKSFNSEVGLPLTILGLPNGWNNPAVWFENILLGFKVLLFKNSYPEYLVLEVGVGKPGDIKKNVAPWLSPDIVVITRFPDKPVHVEFFGSAEKIIEEKSALAYALKKDGLLILNYDDEKVYALAGKVNRKTISYGTKEDATYRATYPTYQNIIENDMTIPKGISFKLVHNGNTYPVILPHVIGMHYVDSALVSLAIANEIGCDILRSINIISEYVTPPGRLSLIEGINNSLLIDDTYNSSPIAMESAIEVLKEIKGKRKIAVIGDMLELGKITEQEHRQVGKKLVDIADIIVTVGLRAKSTADEALKNGFIKKKLQSFDTSLLSIDFLKNTLKKGDIVLIKGSQGIRLERATEAIMAHPELKKELLCRQEKEWQNR